MLGACVGQVIARNSPLFRAGCVGVCGSQRKVGELIEAVWTYSDECTFRVLDEQKKETGSAEGKRNLLVKGSTQQCSVSLVLFCYFHILILVM